MPLVRRRVYFSGRVQGVGFRYTCQSLARGYSVAGYVQNVRDGRVELVAEGEPNELDEFLAAIQLEMGPYIRDADVQTESTDSEPLQGFSIRH